jgi:hypothetical protein
VDNAISYLNELIDSTDKTVADIQSTKSNTEANRAELERLASEAQNAIESVRSSYNDNLSGSLDGLASTIDAAAAKAVDLSDSLKSGSQKLTSAAYAVVRTQAHDEDRSLKYGLVNLLMNLFDRIEFHAGLTPGYVAGKSREIYPSYHYISTGYWGKSWTEKPSSFSLSADAGLNISFRIWRFDLKLMPAFHYNITNNYIHHLQEGVKGSDEVILSTVKPIKWFFTFNGGFAFRF